MWILLIFVVVCFIVGDVLVKKSKLGLIFIKELINDYRLN